MKTLILVRHAKSSWDDVALPDRERPLNDRGERDLATMSKRFARRGAKPHLILSSPALRALATARAFAKVLDYKCKNIVVNDRLYAGQVEDVLDVIRTLDDQVHSVMLVGHNPELTELARHLAPKITHLPTCAIAQCTFDVTSWADIGRVAPVAVAFDHPTKSSR